MTVIIACPCGMIFNGDRAKVAEQHFQHVCPLDVDEVDETMEARDER